MKNSERESIRRQISELEKELDSGTLTKNDLIDLLDSSSTTTRELTDELGLYFYAESLTYTKGLLAETKELRRQRDGLIALIAIGAENFTARSGKIHAEYEAELAKIAERVLKEVKEFDR